VRRCDDVVDLLCVGAPEERKQRACEATGIREGEQAGRC
jgi:hypothetical protein